SFVLSAGVAELLQPSSALIAKILPAAVLVFCIGLLDDLIRLKPWHKLIGQIAVAMIAYASGVRVLGIGGAEFNPLLVLVITVFWLVVCSNAINLMDGSDGLAAGVSLIAAATMLLAAAIQHNTPLVFAIVPLVGGLIGFLRYNFHPASVFLGDCGSLFIGFLLGCYGALWSETSITILGMTAPLIALSLPLADTAIAISRRFLCHQPIFKGDRGHIHHRLLDGGLPPAKVALILYSICAVAGILSLCMGNSYLAVPAILLFGFLAWLGVRRLGYVEFHTFARILVQGSFRGFLRSQIAIQELEVKLELASTADEFWNAVRNSYQEFGLAKIHMRLAGQMYFAGKPETDASGGAWSLTISFADGDFVEMTRQVQISNSDEPIAAFADIIKRTLKTRRLIFLASSEPAKPRVLLSRAASVGA
ncbi:MAG TPA: MraY family glycosyltransferase, partial [Bryobacteraceae bacterium]|nr:MraY family glycosyltransferase [Bryobacteraceae bacterium]